MLRLDRRVYACRDNFFMKQFASVVPPDAKKRCSRLDCWFTVESIQFTHHSIWGLASRELNWIRLTIMERKRELEVEKFTVSIPVEHNIRVFVRSGFHSACHTRTRILFLPTERSRSIKCTGMMETLVWATAISVF